MSDSLKPYRIWLVERRVIHLAATTILLGLLVGTFSNTLIPLPFSLTRASVPIVVYVPAIASIITSGLLVRRLEPYEALTVRPLWLMDSLLLCALASIFSGIMLSLYVLTNQPLALSGARNFCLGLWVAVPPIALLGVRRGSAIVVTALILLVPLTPRGPHDESRWWALAEAPHNSLFALIVVAAIVLIGIVSLKFR